MDLFIKVAADTGRIKEAHRCVKNAADYIRIEYDGDIRDIFDYLYFENQLVYDPLPDPEPEEPQPTQEQRLTALEEENKYLKEALELLLSGSTGEEGETDG